MQRQHPFLSPTGLAVTAALLIVLAFIYIRTGGAMFSPGPLSAHSANQATLGGVTSHAEIHDCAGCHQPLQTRQVDLCLACHENIATQLDAENGLHVRLENVGTCFACHPDHRGVDFDPAAFARQDFDHGLASFSLVHHQIGYDLAPLACESCHRGPGFEARESACQDCHGEEEPEFLAAHTQAFGAGCLDCHDGSGELADFDHSQTGFPLTGAHEEAACIDCHNSGSLDAMGSDCAACHQEPDIHAGLFPQTCGDCHTAAAWQPAFLDDAAFDHMGTAGFSLEHHLADFDGSVLNCTSCHTDTLLTFELETCIACHIPAAPVFMDEHIETFGVECLDCHDGVDRMDNFDHGAFFTLDGAHMDLACGACHVDQTFAGTPNQCAGCHAEPDIHAGLFGLQCESCHSTAAWQPAALTNHVFPLDHGGEGIIPCATCHVSVFTQNTCDACHAPAEMVEEHADEDIFNIAERCTECHPTGLKDEFED